MNDHSPSSTYVELAADIVSAYVSNNAVTPSELTGLIHRIYGALTQIQSQSTPVTDEPTEHQKPAIPLKKSITPDHLICLEDGKKFKSLKRHLRTHYGLSPDDYWEKWGLPPDYPMVSPNYATSRSVLAKEMGLGKKRRVHG